jgi:hypothetical protein
MSQDDASSISVIAFRAERYSQDGKSIVVSFRTKFSSAKRKYLVPMECLRDFTVDLQRLDASPKIPQSRIQKRRQKKSRSGDVRCGPSWHLQELGDS